MGLRPIVKFVFVTDLKGRDFREYFGEIMANFFEKESPQNKRNVEAFRKKYDHSSWGGDESGLALFYLGNMFVAHCKAHFYDRVSLSQWNDHIREGNDFCGVVFRNHDEPRFRKEIFALRDAFHKFLETEGIPFERYDFDTERGYFKAFSAMDPAK